jgi:hypothetical protein
VAGVTKRTVDIHSTELRALVKLIDAAADMMPASERRALHRLRARLALGATDEG